MMKRLMSLLIRFSAVFIVELFYKDIWGLREKIVTKYKIQNTKYYLSFIMATLSIFLHGLG